VSLSYSEQIQKLTFVQELDIKILHLENEKASKPNELKNLEKMYLMAQRSWDEKKEEASQVQTKMTQINGALEMNHSRMKRAEEKLQSVSDNKEFQAATKEVDQLKKMSADLESQKAKIQDNFNQFEESLKDLEEKCNTVKTEMDSKAAEVSGETQKIDGDLQELLSERKNYLSDISNSILSRYDRIRKARSGMGMAPMVGNQCSGCHISLPPQAANQIRKMEEIHECPSCNRILYVSASAE
tara:strand:+ start:1027 stop:1752 length:726 start_codon:yes stop_codon:yes gene_type:complete